MSLSIMGPWAEAARLEQAESATVLDHSPSPAKDTTNEALADSSAIRGINPAAELKTSPKEVRFSPRVNIIEIPDIELPEPSNVTFDDDVVDIDPPDGGTRPSNPSPPKKRVRFSCLKHPKQPRSHGIDLLQMLKRRTVCPTLRIPLEGKKHVRFGAMKSQKINYPDFTFGHRDSEWDEAETRRVFKRECTKDKAMQPLSSITEVEVEVDDDDWNST